jgi:hypothetical protein
MLSIPVPEQLQVFSELFEIEPILRNGLANNQVIEVTIPSLNDELRVILNEFLAELEYAYELTSEIQSFGHMEYICIQPFPPELLTLAMKLGLIGSA